MQLTQGSAALWAGALLLAACTAAETGDDGGESAASPPGVGAQTTAADTSGPVAASTAPLPPAPARDPADLVPGCPGMSPERRPRGSNCFGIFPEQCGADIAARHIGERMTPALVARMEGLAPDGARTIRPGQPVTDDLRYARLNVILDARDRVAKVDCY